MRERSDTGSDRDDALRDHMRKGKDKTTGIDLKGRMGDLKERIPIKKKSARKEGRPDSGGATRPIKKECFVQDESPRWRGEERTPLSLRLSLCPRRGRKGITGGKEG